MEGEKTEDIRERVKEEVEEKQMVQQRSVPLAGDGQDG